MINKITQKGFKNISPATENFKVVTIKDLYLKAIAGTLTLEDMNDFELQSFKNNFGGNLKQDNI